MELSPTRKVVVTAAAALGIVLGAAGITAAATDTSSSTNGSGEKSDQVENDKADANEANDPADANEQADANEANDKADGNDPVEANEQPDTATPAPSTVGAP